MNDSCMGFAENLSEAQGNGETNVERQSISKPIVIKKVVGEAGRKTL